MLLATLRPGKESSAGSILEHLPYTLASLGRAFQIVPCTDLLRYSHTLVVNNKVRTGEPMNIDNVYAPPLG
jgi:hypothetical protein